MSKPRVLVHPLSFSFPGIHSFKGINRGNKCFIVGAGPSLYNLDISKIHDSVVIAVNAACTLMPWDKPGDINRRFWLSNDSLCMKMNYFVPNVLNAVCSRIIRDSWSKYYQQIENYSFNVFKPRKSQEAPLVDSKTELCHVSSVPSAIDFAILMKCNPIYLLGVDHKMVSGNSHFWQFLPENQRVYRIYGDKRYRPKPAAQIEVFDRNIAVFNALNDYANRAGIQIFNCSPISTIQTFPFMNLSDAIQS